MGTGVSANFDGTELFVSPLYEVTSEIEVGDWEYIRSSNRSAYPDSGVQDGYEYQYLGVPFENLLYISKIETGSYIGTGKYGKSNPNTLTFEFAPKIVFLTNLHSNVDTSIGPYGTPQMIDISFLKNYASNSYINYIGFGLSSYSEGGAHYFYSKWEPSTNTLYWYNERYSVQCNEAGGIYYYIAIG